MQHLMQHAVDAQPDRHSVCDRVEMNVGRPDFESPLQQQVDERSGADDVDQFPQLFLQCPMSG